MLPVSSSTPRAYFTPGFLDFGTLQPISPGTYSLYAVALSPGIPLGRFATKEELGSLAVFLLSDALSASVTGQVVDLDGGAKWACGASFNEMARRPEEELSALFEAMRPGSGKDG